MGFIKAVSETTSDNMINIWSDGVSSQGLIIVDKMMFAGESCENGSKIIVRENEILMLLRDGELCDYIAKPGAYIYHEKIEKGNFQGTWGLSFQEISACIGKWMDLHGQKVSPNGIYYLCCNEGVEAALSSEDSLIGTLNIHPKNSEEQTPTEQTSTEQTSTEQTSSDMTVESKPEIWICAACGGKSVGKFCGQCGTMRN